MFFKEEFVASLSNGAFWLFAIAVLICLVGFLVLYIHHFKISRLIKDTPTSKITSAAQGFSEIKGITVNPGPDLISPLSGNSCIWFRYRIEIKVPGGSNSYNWRTIYSGQSPDPVAIQDDTNICFINTNAANIEGIKVESWFTHSLPERFLKDLPKASSVIANEFKITEERIEKGTELYALGTFKTLSSNSLETHHLRAKRLIHEWQKDHKKLLRKFDKNNDLKLSIDEWKNIRNCAQTAIKEAVNLATNQLEVHVLTHSKNYPLIVSTKPERSVANRYRTVSFFFLAMFIFSTLVWSDLTITRL